MARALIRKGYGIAVLLKDEVFEEQYPQYIEQFKKSFGREPRGTELQFVRSAGATALIKLKQLLEQGFHVICYVDGEEGSREEKGWTTIQLYGNPLDVRLGMAVLSQWTGIPIRPIVLTTKDKKLTLRSKDDFHVKSKEEYQAAIQYCYSILEELDTEEIVQWECVPKLFDRLAPSFSPNTVEKPIWLPVYLPDSNMLFDIVSGKCVPMSAMQSEKMNVLRKELLHQFN